MRLYTPVRSGQMKCLPPFLPFDGFYTRIKIIISNINYTQNNQTREFEDFYNNSVIVCESYDIIAEDLV